jgi:hypothetical protein
MSERLTVAFADADAHAQGVAIAGVGTLLSLGGDRSLAPPPEIAAIEGGGDVLKLRSPNSYDLSLQPLGSAAALADGALISLCRASGTIGSQSFDGFGSLTRGSHNGTFALERSLSIFFDAQLGFALAARRPPGARAHGEEQLEAFAFRGEPLEPSRIAVPRLSSTYDAGGLLTHAGIELWESDEAEFALRIGGEALARGELLHPDGARTRVTFIDWHHDGRHGVGSYDITTRD